MPRRGAGSAPARTDAADPGSRTPNRYGLPPDLTSKVSTDWFFIDKAPDVTDMRAR